VLNPHLRYHKPMERQAEGPTYPPVSEARIAAIHAEIEERRADPAFMQRLREHHEAERPLYERLAR
jgi:hypothetical protein